MTKEELDAIISGVTAKLQAATPTPAAPAATGPLPAWIQEAKTAAPAKPAKAKPAKPQTSRRWVAVKVTDPATVKRFGPGYRVIKLFRGADGTETPAMNRPDGKFVTEGEALALFALLSTTPQG